VTIVAISSDSLETSREFAEDDDFPFPLASDLDLEVVDAWGVRHRGKDLAVPSVFVVDRNGVVRFVKIGESISDRLSVEDLLAAVDGV
jgi:peroxiredoxin Q/BCP